MEDKKFRPGAIGALMDLHEQALSDLIEFASTFSQDQFTLVVDTETSDDDCRSVQTILNHVMRAGYGYSNYVRDRFGMEKNDDATEINLIEKNRTAQLKMFEYMLKSVEGLYDLSESELGNHVIKTRWGANIDVDMLLEHAVMHLLRHKRQLEKFKIKYFSKK